MQLKIIHTNDLHGHLEHWPIIESFIQSQKSYSEANNQALLVMDGGDAIDSAHPMVEATQGKIMVDLFNRVGYDVVTLGNNEGLNMGKDSLNQVYSQARFDIAIANLLDMTTKKEPAYSHSIVYREVNNMTIAVIGLTATYPTYPLNGYDILNPVEVLQTNLEKIERDKVDLIILLSHLGIEMDRYLATLFPQIQLILGAHTHHYLQEGEWCNQTLICAAGKYGNFVGEVNIIIDEHTRKISLMQADLHKIKDLSRRFNLEINHRNYYYQEGEEILKQQVIAETPYAYRINDYSFIRMALDAVAKATDSDLAMLSTGLILTDIEVGNVTVFDMHEALPHPMHLLTIEMEGQFLDQLLDDIKTKQAGLAEWPVKGQGFRGHFFGEMVYKGIQFDNTLGRWLVKGETIQHDTIYRLAMVDHYWFLPFFPLIDEKGHPQVHFPKFLRNVVGDYLGELYPLEGGFTYDE